MTEHPDPLVRPRRLYLYFYRPAYTMRFVTGALQLAQEMGLHGIVRLVSPASFDVTLEGPYDSLLTYQEQIELRSHGEGALLLDVEWRHATGEFTAVAMLN